MKLGLLWKAQFCFWNCDFSASLRIAGWVESLISLTAKAANGSYMASPLGANSPGGVQAIFVTHSKVSRAPAKDGTPYQDVSFAHERMQALGVRQRGA